MLYACHSLLVQRCSTSVPTPPHATVSVFQCRMTISTNIFCSSVYCWAARPVDSIGRHIFTSRLSAHLSRTHRSSLCLSVAGPRCPSARIFVGF
ncbi:hypothetical protein CY34DRAFT_196025 [Suillus luteus UH-Slu-Lm8-n1]|uniref:Unplaced genomic scaffold CY34scaffold_131, whole genome shotgun sequence n=1 Tax=Suillus luteus UH-Slu-Lm8-n1 TaxID=930992 RepID=A0A0C9ZUW9_9AGAM|nr:hypothetical protein CY34DRAFT_196025 [Suillus luteus UH-Slu-Lm8-n1]